MSDAEVEEVLVRAFDVLADELAALRERNPAGARGWLLRAVRWLRVSP